MPLTYKEITEQIFNALPMYHKIGSSAYKEGLENIETLLAIVGNPEEKLRTIHVAGTNGKGSVTHLLSSFYQEKGAKVGLYTSPHLLDFRERIKINGEMISKEAVVDFFERFQTDFEQIEPSFFEMTTALAFYHFAKNNVDIAIIEVGLGGRLDATNVIRPDLSIITNISLDHTQLLGNTLAQIAYEKAGIIKPHTPVLIGKMQKETWPVFQQRAEAESAPLYNTENIVIKELAQYSDPYHRSIDIHADGKKICSNIMLPLQGDYQFENVATYVKAILLLEKINPHLYEMIGKGIAHVLQNTHLEGRWQIVQTKPLTICDTGHNSGGFTYISTQLEKIRQGALHLIIGFVNDKDIDSIIRLLPHQAYYHICKATVARALAPSIIIEKMAEAHLPAEESLASVYQTYQKVLQNAHDDDVIYIGGSTFIVADFLQEMKQQKFPTN